jgi:hypothetical protein
MEDDMDEKQREPKTPVVPAPAAKEPRTIPPPPRAEEMIYPELERDPYHWLRH